MQMSKCCQIVPFSEFKEEKQFQAKISHQSRVSEAKVLNANSNLASDGQNLPSTINKSWATPSFDERGISVRLRGIFGRVCGGNSWVSGWLLSVSKQKRVSELTAECSIFGTEPAQMRKCQNLHAEPDFERGKFYM